MTNHEMELYYTETKCIYMEGKEPCRIPVPVDRCPLNKLSMVIKNLINFLYNIKKRNIFFSCILLIVKWKR